MKNTTLFKTKLNCELFADYEQFDIYSYLLTKVSEMLKTDYETELKNYKSINIEDEDEDARLEYLNSRMEMYNSEFLKSLIIMVYSMSEIKLKKILDFCYEEKYLLNKSFEKLAANDNSNYAALKSKFFDELKIDFDNISENSKFNELRELNNCLKHREKVSDELHKTNPVRWIETGKDIVLEKDYIDDLIKAAKTFMTNLVKKILEEIK